jgi:hypothetical protein
MNSPTDLPVRRAGWLGFFRRLALWCLYVLLLLAALWTAFCLEERWRGNRQWQAYRTAAQARGAKLDLANFVRPPVPEAENFAATPLVAELFHAVEAGREPANWFAALKLNSQARPVSRPADEGRLLNLVGWQDFLVTQGVLSAAGDNPARDVLRALTLVEPQLAELRTALQRPQAHYPVRWEDGFTTKLPHISQILRTAQIHQLAIHAHLALGDSASAYEAWAECLRLKETLRDEGSLISGLIRLSIVSLLESSVRAGLHEDRWAAPELRQLAADLARIDLVADWRFALASERAIMNQTMEMIYQGSSDELAQAVQLGMTGLAQSGQRLGWGLYPRGWLRLSQVRLNEFYDAALADLDEVALGQPPRRRPGGAADLQELQASRGLSKLPYLLALLSAPAVEGVREKYTVALASIVRTRAAVSLELHRHTHGSFPTNLTELGEVPRDPIDHAPLRYRRTESGYELWSIGLNRTDDGGTTIEGKPAKEQPDLVFRR